MCHKIAMRGYSFNEPDIVELKAPISSLQYRPMLGECKTVFSMLCYFVLEKRKTLGSKNVREKAWKWPREELGTKGLDTRPVKKE